MKKQKNYYKALSISLFAALFIFSVYRISRSEIISVDLPKREGIEVGPFLFHSALKTGIDFDQNIYLTAHDALHDTITLVNPSFGFMLPFRGNNFSMEYNAGLNFFSRYTENNHTDHRVQSNLLLNLTDYKVTVDDVWARVTDRSGSEDVRRTKRETNDFRLGTSTERKKLRLSVAYKNSLENYLNDDIILDPMTYKDKDNRRNIVDIEGAYRFLPKTSGLLELTAGHIDYYRSSISPNSYYVEGLLGIKGEWYSKITTDVRVGSRFQEYESSSLLDDDHFSGLIARGQLEYSMTSNDSLKLKLERSNYESNYQTLNYYVVNMLGFIYSHRFYKVTAGIFGSAQRNTYPKESTEDGITAKRRDDLYTAGCSLRYDVRKWLSLEATYEFMKRDSRFANLDYTDNLTQLRATIGF